MITYCVWKVWDAEFSEEILEILANLVMSCFTLPFDIILLPLEILSILILKIRNIKRKVKQN